MNDAFSTTPWHTPALWREANAGLKHILQRNGSALDESRRLAYQLKQQLTSTFPHMNRLCREACPACTDVCCQRAWVWVDFRDLLFLHLAGIPVPDQQLLDRQGSPCRYGSPHGCRLERIQRPFVCTWYLCPAQVERLRKKPAGAKRLLNTLQQIKKLRCRMENAFIQAV
jgi:hypothetical protein